jgi:hypothetical protein
MVQCMKRRQISNSRTLSILCGLLLFVAASGPVVAEPTPAAVSGFNSYIAGVESRLAQQHRSSDAFLAPVAADRLRRGEPIVEQIAPSAKTRLPGAMLYDWRGTAFVPGATAAGFERLMKDFNAYPQRFAPQVLQARMLAQQGDRIQAVMRVCQKHVITVVMDTAYDVNFGRLDGAHGWSVSRSTRVAEIEAPGTAKERVLGPDEEHGFLWRMNTYWSFEERDGGLWMQVESVSLSRGIPVGLGWAVRPFVECVPRD